MSRGKAYNIWKSKTKYISRLKKCVYYWLVQDGVKVTKDGYIYKNWRKPKSWKELDEKGGHSKLLKKTVCITPKLKWEKCDDKKRIKDIRQESKDIIDEELNNDLEKEQL